MKRRLLNWCLIALPRERRKQDGEMLRDLALDLGDLHGFLPEILSLLRCGVVARLESGRRRVRSLSNRRRVASVALLAVLAGAIALPVAGGQERAEVDHLACIHGQCGPVKPIVEARQRDGWDCVPTRTAGNELLGWRCSLT